MHDSGDAEWDTISAREIEKYAQTLSHTLAAFGVSLTLFSLVHGWMGFFFVVSSALSLLFTLVVINRVDLIASTPQQVPYCRAVLALLFTAQMILSTMAFVDAIKG